MQIFLSDKARCIAESGTVGFTPLLARLKSQGREIIDFAVGEPVREAPGAVIRAVKQALDKGCTRYGPVAGLPSLRERLAHAYDGYGAQNVLISNGSKQALFLAFQAILNPEDEVIILRPSWVSFEEQVKMAGGRPVFVETRDHQLDADAVHRAISVKTRALVLNSPNNPTGAVYRDGDVRAVLALAATHGIFVLSDEAYRGFVYDGLMPARPYDMTPDRDRLVITRSFSKQYAMTGFRVGYTVAAEAVIRAMTAFQGHCSGNVCTFAQHGAAAALKMDGKAFAAWKEALSRNRDLVYEGLNTRFDCIRPAGAFYMFPSVEKHLAPKQTSAEFAADLLEKSGVAVVPGEAFGAPGHIRISYAVSPETLAEGIKRINEYVENMFEAAR